MAINQPPSFYSPFGGIGVSPTPAAPETPQSKSVTQALANLVTPAWKQAEETLASQLPLTPAPSKPTAPQMSAGGAMDTLGAQPTGIFQAPATTPTAAPAPIAAPPMGVPPQAPMVDAMLPEGGGIPAPITVEGGVSPSVPAPEGMRRTLDPLTGEVIFASEDLANQLGAQETERLQAQQRAREGMTEFMLERALQPTDYDRESAAREQRLDTMLKDRAAVRQAQRGGEAEMTTEERQAEAEAQLAETRAEAARKALQNPDISDYEKFTSELELSDLTPQQKRAATLKRFGLDPLDYPEGGEGVSTAETQDAGSTPATSINVEALSGDDKQAYEWAQANKDDPRAKQILDRLSAK